MKRHLLLLFFLIIYSFAKGQQKIDYVYDLPCYSYKIDTSITKFITTPAFSQFIDEVEKDINYTLQTYQIEDFTTLSNYYLTLAQIHILKKEYEKSIEYIEKAKSIQWKDSYKQCFGLLYRTIAKTESVDKENLKLDFFQKQLKSDLKSIEWKSTHNVLENEHYQTLLVTDDRITREIDRFKNQMNYKKEIASETAYDLIQKTIIKKYINLITNGFVPVLNTYLKKHTPFFPDYYLGCNEATFPNYVDTSMLYPVLVGQIDLGIDTTVFNTNQIYKNKADPIDGKDNDRNGFIDDYHGIAFDSVDLPSKKSYPSLYFTDSLNEHIHLNKIRKGIYDIKIFQYHTPDAEYALTHLIKNKDYKSYIKNLREIGKFLDGSHGTSTAAIILRHNPTAILIPNKIFTAYDVDFTNLNSFNAWIQTLDQMIDYNKKKGVQIINISLYMDFYRLLPLFYSEQKNSLDVCLANKLTGIYIQNLNESCKKIFSKSPEILFIIGAGNNNADVSFTASALSHIDLPNVLIVGGVDCTGDVNYFSAIGKDINIYANSYDLAQLPEGQTQIQWGTSFSCPQVTNLAVKLLAINPNLSVKQLRALILDGATINKEKNTKILNAHRSINLLLEGEFEK